MILDILQLIGGIILCIGYIPQIKKILKTKSVKDLSSITFIMIALGVLLMQFYAIGLVINGSGLMLLITNSMRLITSLLMVILIFIYSKRRIKNETRRCIDVSSKT
jgi:MtN3 and saliva related transmembrane protein